MPFAPARSCHAQRLQSCASRCTTLRTASPLRARSKGVVLSQWPRRRAAMAMERQASRAPITQRGRAGCAAQRAALRAEGLRTRHHRLRPIRPAGFPSSSKGGTPPLPGHTRLSRQHAEQRGHARPPVAALGGRQASPLVPSAQAGGSSQRPRRQAAMPVHPEC